MINVNKITSTLAKLPDQQLQQYAQMHKSDPYIMALAMSESNRRKEMRSAGQGAQGMQEQPKVVDQMVADMAPQQLPEDQGIGQLPAGDMNFAGGGIIAFADGGDVERYSGEFGSFVDGIDPLTGTFYMPEAPPDAASMRRVRSSPYVTPQITAEEAALLQRFPKTPAKPKVDAAPTVDPTRKGPGAGPAAAPVAGPKAPAQAGLGDLAMLRQDILDKQKFTDPAAAGLKELEARELAAAQEDKAALLRDQAKFDDAYKGREKRLSDRELDIGKQKDTNMGLAFLNAGLAIMSTPGGLATAIGKGAQVGTAQFAAGLDKIRSAQERLDEARDKMEDLKLNRAEMSAKEIRAAEKGIRNVGVDAQKRTIDGIRMAADVNEKRATDIYKSTVDVGVNRERIASAEKISGNEISAANARSAAQIAAALNTPDRLVFDKLLKDNNNDPVKALEAFKLAKGDKFDVRSSYADYLKAFAGKEGLTPPMSMGAYAGQFGATLPR
jgi:hypothetical protein